MSYGTCIGDEYDSVLRSWNTAARSTPVDYPLVVTEKLLLSGGGYARSSPRRRRRRRNKRMHFKRVKSHNVVSDVRSGHLGFSTPQQCADGDTFHGFDNASISWSLMKWHQASERLIECGPLVSSTCVSVPLVGNGNTFVFKVHPVPLRTISVLSLFDGIGSAYQILQNSLGLKIGTYFSCEIDSDAIQVLKHTYHGRIVLLGCVKKLNAPLLHALGRVDLLLGGSPCNNLSRVNPRRLGLHEPGSSGGLFFEYVRIRDILSDLAMRRGDPFFWFYEQTAHLDAGVCDTMSRCLGSEPVRCCSSSVVPMRRIRNFWSNVPRLSETAGELAGGRATRLQDFLMPFRQANVRCLPTLTTNSSSEQGRGRELPVLEDGSQCSLSVTECEQLFGFPPHYTDCANLSVSRRRRLLGRAWCIPLVSKLLHPIAEMFEKDLPCHNFL